VKRYRCHKTMLCSGVQALPGGPGGAASCATVITRRNPHGRTAATQQARTILVTTEGTPRLQPNPDADCSARFDCICISHFPSAACMVCGPTSYCAGRSFVIWVFGDCRWAPGRGH
jgi:hypothetical protein